MDVYVVQMSESKGKEIVGVYRSIENARKAADEQAAVLGQNIHTTSDFLNTVERRVHLITERLLAAMRFSDFTLDDSE